MSILFSLASRKATTEKTPDNASMQEIQRRARTPVAGLQDQVADALPIMYDPAPPTMSDVTKSVSMGM